MDAKQRPGFQPREKAMTAEKDNEITSDADACASQSEASTASEAGRHLFSDYHLHPQGHRLQPYTRELLQPWADQARKIGLRDIALTDHDRYHRGVDFDEIERVREANPDVKIRAGIELDNDPVHSAEGRRWVEKHWDRLDFVLGSVHFLRGDWAFDHAGEEAEFQRRDLDEVYLDYYERIRTMAQSGLVDCMSHLDLVKIFGFRATKDLRPMLESLLSEIKNADLAMELSTAGWRKPVGELYPSDDIIRLAQDKAIPFTTASDGHSHVQQGENFARLAEKMEGLGICEVAIYERHHRTMQPL